ncbi:DUF4255 domain-containing protein [Mycetohabitans sp. B7]|nr:DUF4255 domain-containing protein [Mycetohabitans sp. B7]
MDRGEESESMQPIITLNKAIALSLEKYLLRISDESIDIRFDIPDKTLLPDMPTVCVFLYDIQEDLELRHGQSRQYCAKTGTFDARQVNVRCCYLVTYWEQPKKEGMKPDGQPMIVMNAVLDALLSAELGTLLRDAGLPSFARVIAPLEHLSSLGNFWQSLGDRPRLCLNFQVTIPIKIVLDQPVKAPPVLSTELESSKWEQYDKSLPFKRALVKQVLQKSDVNTMPEVRAQLARLAITCEYKEPDQPVVHVSGLLDQATNNAVEEVIKDYNNRWNEIDEDLPNSLMVITDLTVVNAPAHDAD